MKNQLKSDQKSRILPVKTIHDAEVSVPDLSRWGQLQLEVECAGCHLNGARDENLIQRVFGQMFLPHLDSAHNLARWILRNDHDAKDAVQEAYLLAYRAFARFRGGSQKAWIMTIVRRVCYGILRKWGKHQGCEPFDEEFHHVGKELGLQDAGEQKANLERLHRALKQLPSQFHDVIVLHDLKGVAYKEIAAVLGIPIGTVMSRLARARGRLRREFFALQTEIQQLTGSTPGNTKPDEP